MVLTQIQYKNVSKDKEELIQELTAFININAKLTYLSERFK